MNEPTRARPAVVLLAEDSEDDVLITRLGFERARFAVDLHHVENGEECLAFLRRQGPYGDAPSVDLLLLDLNMPRMDGHEVLAEVQADERLRNLPIVVLTTSEADADILSSYRLSCNSYIVKPVDFEKFAAMVQTLNEYWFTLVVLPTSVEDRHPPH